MCHYGDHFQRFSGSKIAQIIAFKAHPAYTHTNEYNGNFVYLGIYAFMRGYTTVELKPAAI